MNKIDKPDISRRNVLKGAGMTVAIERVDMEAAFLLHARAYRESSQILEVFSQAHGRVGLVGYHAPGFIDMQADPFQLKTELGLQLRHYGLSEFIAMMDGSVVCCE